jgi:RHS repeat-associated protein
MNSDPSADSNYPGIDYSLQVYQDGNAYLYESGNYQGSFAINDRLWIWRRGSTLYYGTGPDFVTASTSGLKRAVNGATGTLSFDSSFHDPGTKVEAKLEGVSTPQRRFLHADERGSIIAHSDAAGNVTAINRYDDQGTPQGGGIAGRFGFTGQAWMPHIGMYDYKARIYNPGLGRFMQPDPIGYGDGANMYAYVAGDPVNATDPSGLAEVCVPAPGSRIPECRLAGDEDGDGDIDSKDRGVTRKQLHYELANPLVFSNNSQETIAARQLASTNPQSNTGILQNPYVLVRMTPGSLAHIAIQHGSYAVANKSVFLPERRNVSDLYSMFNYAIQRSIPTPSYNNTLVYSVTYPRPVGWERGTGMMTYNVTVVAQFTGGMTRDGRRILDLVTMYPGLP